MPPDPAPPPAGTDRPAVFARLLLNALSVSSNKSRRRKRDQKADETGLALKCAVLEQLITDDPAPDHVGDWLLDQVLATPANGALRAVAAEILNEYQLARTDPVFAEWLSSVGPRQERGDRQLRRPAG
jgi:hypothetical protein